MSDSNFLSKIAKSEGILLALAPLAGTYVAFVYEFGYLSFYDVPINFIHLEISHIIIATIAVTLFFEFFYIVLESLLIFAVGKGKSPLRRALITPIITIAFLFLIGFSVIIPDRWWLIPCAFVIIFLVKLIPPIIKDGQKTTYLERLDRQLQEEERNTPQSSINAKAILSFLLFGSMIVMGIGRYTATTKTRYLISRDRPNAVVVEIFGETIILKTINTKTRYIESELIVMKQGEKDLLLKYESVGPLLEASHK